MESHDDKRRKLIAQAVFAAGAVDRQWVQPWAQLAAHLSPLIGESGFTALYRRTVRLVSADYGWLASPAAGASAEEMLVGLRAQCLSVEPAAAREANAALLSTFTKLLSGLIGEALTVRLLNAAWNCAAENENAREQS